MRARLGFWLSLFSMACGSSATPQSKSVVAQAPPAPPTPATVTLAQPGGDAADPHAAALQRLITEPWGQQGDKDGQLVVALPDSNNWKRVRYWGVEHFLGFRYGKDHHAMVVVFSQEMQEESPSSEDCLKHFDAWGRPQIQAFDVQFDPFHPHHARFRDKPMISLAVDGRLSLGFARPEFSAAWAAYSLYPKACLITAVAVPWRSSPELAQKVRDRFVMEGFAQLSPLTEVRPVRK